MLQHYHVILRPRKSGDYVGWVEEVPGTVTCGPTLPECRDRLRQSLLLILETHRHEARLGWHPGCLQEAIEVEVADEWH